MRVQFDLRPASMLEKERKKTSFNLTRLLAMLLLLFFFASCGFYVLKMGWEVKVLGDEILNKEDEVSGMEGAKQALEAEIQRLRGREKVFADTLKIMQDDLPTLEILNALETHMPEYGMGITTLRFQPAANAPLRCVLEGTAANETQIIDLSDGLSGSGIFTSVTMPTSRKDEKTGRVTFTLNMDVLPIGQIKPFVGLR